MVHLIKNALFLVFYAVLGINKKYKLFIIKQKYIFSVLENGL